MSARHMLFRGVPAKAVPVDQLKASLASSIYHSKRFTSKTLLFHKTLTIASSFTSSSTSNPHYQSAMASRYNPPQDTRSNTPSDTSTDLTAPWSVESALSQISPPPPSSPTSPIPFFHILERLKTTKREGWRRFGIKDGESIADHMYRMSIITMLAPPSLAAKLNIAHCTKMALIHDMAESLVGDITPVEGVTKQEKHRREKDTMDFLTKRLLGRGTGTEDAGRGMREIWQEYEKDETLEAKFVHDVDKIELLLQMVEYEKEKKGKINLEEFKHVASRIQLEEVKGWYDEILAERQDFWDSLEEEGNKRQVEINGNGR